MKDKLQTGKKIFANCISDKEFVSRMYTDSQNNSIKNRHQKIGRRHNEALSLTRMKSGHIASEKMFNTISHSGKADENHNEKLLHIYQNGCKKSSDTTTLW